MPRNLKSLNSILPPAKYAKKSIQKINYSYS